jgi:hypothetical protein
MSAPAQGPLMRRRGDRNLDCNRIRRLSATLRTRLECLGDVRFEAHTDSSPTSRHVRDVPPTFRPNSIRALSSFSITNVNWP